MAEMTREERQDLVHKFDDFYYWIRTLILTGMIGRETVDGMINGIISIEAEAGFMKRFDELELSVRSQNLLANAEIQYVYQIVLMTERDLIMTKLGRKGMKEIMGVVADMGLSIMFDWSMPHFVRQQLCYYIRKLVGKP
ncbi:MAG: DNA-directed RNA polymerase subunit alpha C-terminal domain-containing protein [Patescibacteria group bacterium]|jgi:hypothetical protein